MTVSTTNNRAGFTCNGATYVFPFDFKILAASDLNVYLHNTTTGITTQLTRDIDYSVEIADPGPGGTVTLMGSYGPPVPPGVIPSSAFTLTILRVMPRTQEVDFVNGDNLDERNIEGMGDRITMMVQELDEEIGRSLMLPPISSISNLLLPVPSAGKYLRWNALEDGLENSALADANLIAISDLWETVVDKTDLVQSLNALGLDPSLATFGLPENVTISDYAKTFLDDATASDALTTLGVSSFAKTLLDDATAATARATLEIPAASETDAGMAELATHAETDAGTDDTRIVTPHKLYETPGIYRRNAVINGDMRIAQRGASFATGGVNTMTLDMFGWRTVDGTERVTVSQSVDAPSGTGLLYSIKVDVTTAVPSPFAVSGWALRYAVEGWDFAQFKDRTGTLSFWVKSPKTGTHSVALRNSGGDCGYVAEYTVLAANTWEKKSIVIVFNYSTGTWNLTNGVGLDIRFSLGVGADQAKAPGTWGASYVGWGSTNQVNCLDNTANDFNLTGVQLELGSVATSFEFRPYQQELALCQRYYQLGYAIAYVTAGYAHGGSFVVEMRATPTMTHIGWIFTASEAGTVFVADSGFAWYSTHTEVQANGGKFSANAEL